MKRIPAILALSAALPALAADFEGPIRAQLTGFQEVPAVFTTAHGNFTARVASDGQSVDYELFFGDLQASVTQAHIHFAQKSVNGSIIVWLCGTASLPGPAGTPTCPQSGFVRGTFTKANVLASQSTQQLQAQDLDALVIAMRIGLAYVNVHTATSPGGEIRGQLAPGGQGR
jgi:hypothetical protein